jgi:hypothetical protein
MDPQIPVQNVQSEPVTVPPATVPEKPKSNNNILIVLFSLLVVLLIGSTGFLYYQNMNLQKQILSLKATPIPVASPSPIPDFSASWKTYTDKTNNYSFKYPTDWTMNSFGALTDPTNSFSLSVEVNKTSLSVTQWKTNKCIISGTNFCSDSFSSSFINFDYDYIQYNHPKSQYDSIDTLVAQGNQIFDFSLASINPNQSAMNNENTRQIYDQIISTLTFAGQTSGTTISNEYSIQIPSSWNGKYEKKSGQSCDTYTFIGKTMNYELFSICKESLADWTAQGNLPDQPSKLASSGDNVYVESGPLDVGPLTGDDLATYENLYQDYQSIIKSFKLN